MGRLNELIHVNEELCVCLAHGKCTLNGNYNDNNVIPTTTFQKWNCDEAFYPDEKMEVQRCEGTHPVLWISTQWKGSESGPKARHVNHCVICKSS